MEEGLKEKIAWNRSGHCRSIGEDVHDSKLKVDQL